MSFTLNRVYTEWYRAKGYSFTITSSTAYDQKFIYGRNIFDNIEQIVELQPQVLLMSTMSQTDEQVQQLEAAGVHVVVSDAQDIEGVYTAIHMIGELVGKQDEAASVVESMQKTFDEIKANAGDGSKTVYFEVSPLQYGLWTAGTGTFMDLSLIHI